MSRLFRNSIVAILAVGVTALAGCGADGSTDQNAGAGEGDGPQKGGTVHMLQNTDFSYLDPARGWDGGVNAFYRLMYRGLTMQTAGDAEDPNAIVADLATGLGEPSEDGLTWTYTLKDDIFFDNGDPITSTEVKFGISRAWDPQIGIGSPYLKNVIDAPDGYEGPYVTGDLPTIETPDEKTIVFHLKEPYLEFDNVLAQANAVPFPEGSGAGDEFIKDVIASGPHTLDSYTPGSSIKLVRNEFWEPESDDVRKGYPDAWDFEIGIDPATIDERMIAGQGADQNAIASKISSASLARIQTPELQERALTAPAYCTTYMGLNTTKEPFDDVLVRQAVNYAIDRSSVQNASGGTQLADIATSIIPPTVTGHKDFDLYPSDDNAGDPEKAKELLAEAGLEDGVSFTLDIRTNPVAQAQAEAVQESLAKANIDVKLNVIDASIFYETIATPSQQHDAAITGWCPDWASSASTFIPPLFDGRNIVDRGNQNLAQFDDDAVNARIDEIMAMGATPEAAEAWGELDELIMESAPIAPLALENGIFVPGENIAGYYPNSYMTDLTIVGLKDPSRG